MEIKNWSLAKIEFHYLKMRVVTAFSISVFLILKMISQTILLNQIWLNVFDIAELAILMICLVTLIYTNKFSNKMKKENVDKSSYSDEYFNYIHHQALKKVTRLTAAFCLILYFLVRDYFPTVITFDAGLLLVLCVMSLTYAISISYYLLSDK